ncbi:MAG: hypothetical protein ACE5MI_08690 [Acidimicrobiia bacterium]
MPQQSRLQLDLRRRILDWALGRDELSSLDLREVAPKPPSAPLPDWIERSAEKRKRPVFDRWQR